MRRLASFLLATALVAGARGTSGQELPEPLRLSLELPARLSLPPPTEIGSTFTLAALPPFPSERLTLPFPFVPRRFSFEAIRPVVPQAFDVPPVLYRAEAEWLRAGPLTLDTIGESTEAIGLDCRLTCRTVTELSISEDARLHLGGTRALPDNYLYIRNKQISGPSGGFVRGGSNLLSFGLGGALDL